VSFIDLIIFEFQQREKKRQWTWGISPVNASLFGQVIFLRHGSGKILTESVFHP